MLSADLRKLHAALALEPRTTAQLAIDCKWSLDDASTNMVALEREGLVARVSARAVNVNAVKWRLTSAAAVTVAIEWAAKQERGQPVAEPEVPVAPAWAATTDAPPSAPGKVKRPASGSNDVNPYEAPAHDAADAHATPPAQPRSEAEGHFWLGFAGGVTLGLIAFIGTRQSAPETHRGASWGAAAQFLLVVVWRLVFG